MSRELIREYVSLVLERIRPGKHGETFSLAEFKKLPVEKLDHYAAMRLEQLGQGTSRTAYLLSSKKVLKIARDRKDYKGKHTGQAIGQQQNKAETNISHDPAAQNFVARVLYGDPKGTWIVSELVRKISWDEFKSLTGEEFRDFQYQVRAIQTGDTKVKASDFARSVAAMLQKYRLNYMDILVIEHWGKTPDGRAVILDYGLDDLTTSMYDTV